MKRILCQLALIACLLTLWLPAAAAPAPQAQTVTPTPSATSLVESVDVKAILDSLTPAEKVGQLFLVTFQGSDVSPESDIATLVRDYHVGGVVLLPGNDNFSNLLAPEATITVTAPVTVTPQVTATLAVTATLTPTATQPVTQSASATPSVAATATLPVMTPRGNLLSTPQQIVQLSNALQALAMSPGRPITRTGAITATSVITSVATITPTQKPKTTKLPTPTATLSTTATGVPLLIALDWPGDDSSFFSGTGGFIPLPSAMSMGATWTPSLADQVGQVVGRELRAVGVNLLLGPTLDVLDVPRPGSKGDLDTRTFGGDPFWVGQMGQAFIHGVETGSENTVLTAAKYFPGQGASDRRPEDEVATVQKSLEQLRQIELAPFASVTAGGDPHALGATAALMTSHIRYRGFQGNIRQLTPPISLAPQLQDLMALKEFADWRAAGGLLVSDALGVPALRRYYDPTLTKFPYRQVAQDAFLAGNDLLYLGRFALTDNWPDEMTAIKETILFFQDKYGSDSGFRARVDAAVDRILRMKLRIYDGNWQPTAVERDVNEVSDLAGEGTGVTQAVARAGVTLIYPGRDEFADRMPSAPLADETILIFTDARTARECPTCAPTPLIPAKALEEIIQRLYGPKGTGQVTSTQVHSLTFSDLNRMLNSEPGQARDVEKAIAEARWIIFAQLNYAPDEYPESAALQTFLAKRSDSLRDKRLVAMAFSAPYYLDTTEISKLTAYFGIYSRTEPFLEAAVRALFREFSPVGAPPVSVSGTNYDLIRQLEPLPGQVILLSPVEAADKLSGSIKVGSQIVIETGIIRDRNGNPVPDGTPVEFSLRYPTESLVLAPQTETTVGGKARTTVMLDRPGDLWITAQAGEAKDSTRIELKIGGDTPGTIATVVPTPTIMPTPTSTSTPEPTSTEAPTPVPTMTPMPEADTNAKALRPRVALVAFLFGMVGSALAGGTAFAIKRRRAEKTVAPNVTLIPALEAALWAIIVAWIAYLLYALGWLPGATALQAKDAAWAAGMVTFIAGALSSLWTGRQKSG